MDVIGESTTVVISAILPACQIQKAFIFKTNYTRRDFNISWTYFFSFMSIYICNTLIGEERQCKVYLPRLKYQPKNLEVLHEVCLLYLLFSKYLD